MRFEYYKNGSECSVPCIKLKSGETGVIECVSFYRTHDYLKGNYKNGKRTFFLDMFSFLRLGSILETMSDENIGELVYHTGCYGFKMPVNELMEIRELEQYLRRTVGDYRQ
jgi:hypothetical protein